MKKVLEYFLKYVKIGSGSDASSGTHPSTEKQLHFARILQADLAEAGLEKIRLTREGYLYAQLPASCGLEDRPVLGLIAHMDTASEAGGDHVRPRIIEHWDGKPLLLGDSGIVLKPESRFAGKGLVVTDGTTLLGADDKGGISVILAACREILEKNIPHGRICIGFTPDEEIGEGADFFDVEAFGADFAYTVDAGNAGLIEYENFNAASATVRFTGVSVHPGYAKNIMVNAQKLAMLFHAMLPENESPEHTEGREGFFHLTGSCGSTGTAELHYILRDHDPELLEKRKAVMREAQKKLASVYGANSVALEMKDEYRNMIEVMKDYPFLVEIAKEAIAAAGLEVICEPIRGGTDGARLCFMGLPCPNIGHGGYNPHGEREYTVIEEMESAVQVVLGIVQRFAENRCRKA